MEDTDP